MCLITFSFLLSVSFLRPGYVLCMCLMRLVKIFYFIFTFCYRFDKQQNNFMAMLREQHPRLQRQQEQNNKLIAMLVGQSNQQQEEQKEQARKFEQLFEVIAKQSKERELVNIRKKRSKHPNIHIFPSNDLYLW